MAAKQIWFLIWEDVESPVFKQIKLSLDDVKKNGLSLPEILQLLKLVGQPGQFSFFMHSVSVWERSSIRDQWKQHFAPMWEKRVLATHDRHSTIAQLRETNPNFTQACINFIHDLRTFGGDKGSRARLEGTGHEFYFGRPYTDNATVNAIMNFKTIGWMGVDGADGVPRRLRPGPGGSRNGL